MTLTEYKQIAIVLACLAGAVNASAEGIRQPVSVLPWIEPESSLRQMVAPQAEEQGPAWLIVPVDPELESSQQPVTKEAEAESKVLPMVELESCVILGEIRNSARPRVETAPTFEPVIDASSRAIEPTTHFFRARHPATSQLKVMHR